MNIDTITLQCFISLAETGSFTTTAEQVGRTQSAVSQQMAKLEKLLGKSLYHRGKFFSLTKEGELFLSYAKQIYALHREAIDRFKEPDLSGEVRFGLPEDFASRYLSEILVDFSRIHPRVFLNVECDLTLRLFEKFKQGQFDLVLLKMNKPADFASGMNVCSEKLEWVGDVNLIKQKKDFGIPLVLSPEPCVYRARAISALNHKKIKWRLVFSSQSYAGTLAAVKAGLGITVLPRTMIPPDLKAIHSNQLTKLSDTHISLLKHDTKNPAILSFEKFVFEKLVF
jgi:DNA-binding transcriptional LysR family regulator